MRTKSGSSRNSLSFVHKLSFAQTFKCPFRALSPLALVTVRCAVFGHEQTSLLENANHPIMGGVSLKFLGRLIFFKLNNKINISTKINKQQFYSGTRTSHAIFVGYQTTLA